MSPEKSAPMPAMTETEICEAARWFQDNLRDGIAKHSAKHGLRLVAEVRRLRSELTRFAASHGAVYVHDAEWDPEDLTEPDPPLSDERAVR